MSGQGFDEQLADIKLQQAIIGPAYPRTIDYAERMSKLAALIGDDDSACFYADLAERRRKP